jgi:NAD(P)-dependent dehydrogenase (short-subunit alcohol dehydrogenase family)
VGVFAVTGSAGGIGGAIVARLGSEGHRVIGVDLRDADVEADLSTDDGRSAAVTAVSDSSGGALDGLVVCAGVAPSVRPASVIVQVNYFGAVQLLDGLRPLLEKGERPAAVAICSNSMTFAPSSSPLIEALLAGDQATAAALADANPSIGIYGESKMALGRALRRRAPDWAAAGVRLNGVAPGPVPTTLLVGDLDDPELGDAIRGLPVPLGRWGEPAEIAEAVWFLLSPASAWTHGSILFVDGGTDALVRPDHV